MWKKIGKVLAKAAVWAIGNSDDVIAIVNAVKKGSK